VPMTAWRIALRSVAHYRRSDLAVALGVAVAVAVLAGSLLVGDSVRGSLRAIALERLGPVWCSLSADGGLTDGLIERLDASAGFARRYGRAAPLLLLGGSVQPAEAARVVPGVSIVGADEAFWHLYGAGPGPVGRQVFLNRRLADDLSASVGDDILLSFGRSGRTPAYSILGRRRREDTVAAMRLNVGRVLDAGPAEFDLRADPHGCPAAFVPLRRLQEALGLAGRVNTIVFALPEGGLPRTAGQRERTAELAARLPDLLRLDDLGLHVESDAEQRILAVQSRRLALPASAEDAVRAAADVPMAATSIYLANSLRIVRGGAETGVETPYSVVLGVESLETPPLGPADPVSGRPTLGPGEIVLNSWAAEDLGARPGDDVALRYYIAGDDGAVREVRRTFALSGVVPTGGAAASPVLVPEFEGITDAETMADWDPPFAIDLDRIRPKDEEYWDRWRTAPKAFLPLEAVREMWHEGAASGTEVDWRTGLVLSPPVGVGLDELEAQLLGALSEELAVREPGCELRAVRADALDAAGGSSDFGLLFASMSAFLVAAAAILVGLLFRLAIGRRAAQYGLMAAVGLSPGAAARVLLREGVLLAAAGGVAGVLLAVLYARGLVHALGSRWSGAVAELPLALHVEAGSLLAGAGLGLAASAGAMVWACRSLKRAGVLQLLAGWRFMEMLPSGPSGRALRIAGLAVPACGLGLLLAAGLRMVSALGAFFVGGAALLLGGVLLMADGLQRAGGRRGRRSGVSLWRLAWHGAARNRTRSVLTAGLLASASFVIVAVAANRRDVSALDVRNPTSGAGGFALRLTCDVPVYVDLTTAEGQSALGFSSSSAAGLQGVRVVSFRLSDGDDASCLNMRQPDRPRVLGVPDDLIERDAFTFSATVPMGAGAGSPWRLLNARLPDADGGVPVIPAIADAASARWILKKELGDEIALVGAHGREVRLRIVGLVASSVFQSELLVSDADFRRHFGADGGYRYFLADVPPGRAEAVRKAFRTELGELGVRIDDTAEVLAAFARVQNTYLAAFETLGGLGLLLGTFGVVTVLLRGVLERRSELAVLMAFGLRRRTIVAMIVTESALLLSAGMALGAACALIAVAPHLAGPTADVNTVRLGAILAGCLLTGLAASAVAAALSVRRDLIPALRSE